LLRRLFIAAAVIELAAAGYTLVFGGFNWTIGPLRISAGGPLRPFVIGIVCAGLALWLSDRGSRAESWYELEHWSWSLAALGTFITLIVGVSYSVSAAGAADPYGYVSQAGLWAKGHLAVKEPLAAIDPIIAPGAGPLGYRLIPPDTIVPIYSPGLPILMALASFAGGERAIYLVVPILGALTVWLTFRLGRMVSGPRTGLVAAVLLSCSPVFLEQLFLPMADLPATAWLLAAIVLALSDVGGSAFLAGLASAAAVVTRPNLLPLGCAVIAFVAWKRASASRFISFAAGLLPSGIFIALFNQALYGSPVSSGYGSLDTLFRLEWVATNMSRYPRWLIDVHSIAILIGVAAPFLALRPNRDREEADEIRSGGLALLLLAYCLLVVLCYIAYVPFEGWPYLRFWLPAIPVLFVLAAAVAVTAIGSLPVPARTATLLICTCLLGAWYLDKTQALGVFFIEREEQRYATIGNYLSQDLPRNAVILSGMQSGSLRLYGGNRTLRWDQFGPRDLDRVVALLKQAGFAPYLLAEGDEEMLFRQWFGPSQVLGKLDWRPSYEYFGHQHARVYAFEEREREWNTSKLRKAIPED
jgi:Dolichyl-phosphate-mannose-protein mannosyltransferase